MGDWLFIMCKTCKRADWIDVEDILGYIEDHEGHNFRIMNSEVYDDQERFRTWFLEIMGWPEEAEG